MAPFDDLFLSLFNPAAQKNNEKHYAATAITENISLNLKIILGSLHTFGVFWLSLWKTSIWQCEGESLQRALRQTCRGVYVPQEQMDNT